MNKKINFSDYDSYFQEELNKLEKLYVKCQKKPNDLIAQGYLDEQVFTIHCMIKSALVCHTMTQEKAEELREYIWGLRA